MDALPEFTVLRPDSLKALVAARKDHPASRLLGGGTDLMVNIRRGIEAPETLIDVAGVPEIKAIEVTETRLEIGAGVTLAEVASHPDIARHFPAVAQAAASIAGPTQRMMGTVGGNVCLDTRCIFYNQSDWWRNANKHCLKTTGEMCHVAPKSDGVCFATYSGDLAPALLLFGGMADVAGPGGTREVPLTDLYIGYGRADDAPEEKKAAGEAGDGKRFLALRPGETVTGIRASRMKNQVSAYEKIRIRRSIEYPVAGVGAALSRDGDTLTGLKVAITGTNPRPVLLDGSSALAGGPLDDSVFEGLDALVRDQVMSMKTTFTPGTYRRKVAGVLAARLVRQLWKEAGS